MQKVMVAGIPFEVIECHENFGSEACGEIEYRKQIIRINEDMAPEYKEQTLIHEIVHGILVSIGRNDLSDDEVFVQSLAAGIYTSSFQIKEEK
jgi:Zn-dependent peptidase ImmA (M78 family)